MPEPRKYHSVISSPPASVLGLIIFTLLLAITWTDPRITCDPHCTSISPARHKMNIHNWTTIRPLYNALHRLLDLLIRHQLNRITLTHYKLHDTVPFGLGCARTPPQFFSETQIGSWNAICHQTSLNFLKLTIASLKLKIRNTFIAFNSAWNHLYNISSIHDFYECTRSLYSYARSTFASLLRKKSSKLLSATGCASVDANLMDNFRITVKHTCISRQTSHSSRRFTNYFRLPHVSQDNWVVNKSNKILSDAHLSILSKGLTFCPYTPTFNKTAILTSGIEYTRRLRLKEFFATHESYQNTDNVSHQDQSSFENQVSQFFKPASSFTPSPNHDTFLDLYISDVMNDLTHINPTRLAPNISAAERVALSDLMSDSDIIIKSADKGGALVLLNREDYLSEAYRQLNNPSDYCRIPVDPSKCYYSKIKRILNQAVSAGHLERKHIHILLPENSKPGRFYLLPKIHKEGCPGRPIVSGSGSMTESISKFVDLHIGPLVPKLSSYIKDTNHFLTIINDLNANHTFDDNTLLVTIDVKSLYTNIPHDECIQAATHYLDNTLINEYPPSSFIASLMKIVLQFNFFSFNNEFFLQEHGIAMGTKMAPSAANLFMGHFETRFLGELPNSPLIWRRFIDDIFVIWPHGHDSLIEFMETLNSFHSTIGSGRIKFTHTVSPTSISFLDVQVNLINHKLETDLFSKPTDTHQYLHFNSFHPRHIINSLPYSLALRIVRICSSSLKRRKHLDQLRLHLVARKYPLTLINRCIRKALTHSRNELLSTSNPPPPNSKIPFITPFFGGAKQPIKNAVYEHLPLLRRSSTMNSILDTNRPTLAFQRCQNLKDILVKADLNPSRPQKGFFKCNSETCSIDIYTINTNQFTSPLGQIFQIKQHISCDTPNVIYLITCKKCRKQYVGETGRFLRIRLKEHLADITHNRATPISLHFNLPDHNIQDFNFIGIENLHSNSLFYRRLREVFWIIKLCTFSAGLNTHLPDDLRRLAIVL